MSYGPDKIRFAECCITVLEIIWLLFVIPAYSKLLEVDLNEKLNSQVKVRAVFINCEMKEQMPYGPDILRFQREELFKHSTVRNCKMKLALTVKIFSDSSQQPLDDEYIPIEHVFESSNRKRVRLLNPYILRLRREPLYETYKLHETDTFSGLLTASKEIISQFNKTEAKNLKKRNTELNCEKFTAEDESVLKQWCQLININNWHRKKRLDVDTATLRILEDTFRNWSNQKFENKQYYKDKTSITEETLDQIRNTENNYTEEKEFVLYEIGNPEIWFRAHVQLLAKLSTSEGKNIWRDLCEKESAWVSTNSPEWRNQELSIRYRCGGWISREDFTLPSNNNNGFRLLLPRDGKIINGVNNADNIKFLIVPYDDIKIEKNEEHIKREDNSSINISTISEHPHRRALIRISRALFGGSDDNYMVINEESDKYLRIPYTGQYHARIDVEAKADENQLVYVGTAARLTTVVSESTRRSRTTLTVQATNTGLAAARFRPKIRECSPEIMKTVNEDDIGQAIDPILIPPMHSSTFRFELSVEGPGDVTQCSVALLNDDDESVAIRDVRIKRGDRCFCVWHCECVCLSEDPKLHCQEMADYQQLVAGLSPHKRPRQVRAASYPDVISINLIVVIMGVIIFLLVLGFIKACLGLLFRCIGSWGIDQLIQTPDTKKRPVRLISKSMEFVLNIIFFITLPCLALWNCFKILFSHFQSKEVDKSFIAKDNKKTISSYDMQKNETRRKWHCRKKGLLRWMTPQAEKLSTDIWRHGLAAQGLIQPKCMSPLLKDDRYSCQPCVLQSSMVDSECDDTEYVLLQMQKSKESLAKNSQATWKGQ